MSKKLLKNISKGIGYFLLGTFYLSSIGFTIWGLYWSFHRYGSKEGLVSVIVLPYATYRGVASIWDEPKWKEDFKIKTEHIAILIETAGEDKKRPDIEANLSKLKVETKEWIAKLPDDQKIVLKDGALSYSKALLDFYDNCIKSIQNSFNINPFRSDKFVKYVNEFKYIEGYYNIWQDYNSERKKYFNLGKEQYNNLEDIDKELLTEEYKALNSEYGKIREMSYNDYKRIINYLFGDDQ